MKKKEKKQISYVDAHNKAVKTYKRSSLFIFWGGIVNAISTILAVFNIGNIANSELAASYRYSLNFTFNRFLFNAIEYSDLNIVVQIILILLIAFSSSALLAFVGYSASLGKIKFLIGGGIFYLIDFILTFIYDNIFPFLFEKSFNWTLYAFSIATHVVILGFIVVAIINYYKVIHIEKKHQEFLENQIKNEPKEEK